MRTITCALCGKPVKIDAHHAKYCPDCRTLARKISGKRREERRRERQILEGRRPDDDLHLMDSPENVAVCLDCPLPDCNMNSRACPLYGIRPARVQKGGLQAGDMKICNMIHAGWRDGPLCRELGISADDLKRAKKRLKRQGKIG